MCFLDVAWDRNVYSSVLTLPLISSSVIQKVVLLEILGSDFWINRIWNTFLECQQLESKRQYFSEA